MTELLLVESTERRWFGVVRKGDELFKVIIFPGSATTEWHAILTPTLFVELTEGNKLTQAIERGLDSITKQPASKEEILLKVVEDAGVNSELMEDVLKILKG